MPYDKYVVDGGIRSEWNEWLDIVDNELPVFFTFAGVRTLGLLSFWRGALTLLRKFLRDTEGAALGKSEVSEELPSSHE